MDRLPAITVALSCSRAVTAFRRATMPGRTVNPNLQGIGWRRGSRSAGRPEGVGVPDVDCALWSDGTETAIRRTCPDGDVEYARFSGSPPGSLVGPGTRRNAVYRVLADANVTVSEPRASASSRSARSSG